MEADFAVELGADDETLELPWSTATGPRYYDLKCQPESLLNIEEARRVPELGEFLAAVNSPGSALETAKCDAWSSTEINSEEEIFGAARKFGSYVDLIFSTEPARFAFAEHEQFARRIIQFLQRTPQIPAAAEFLIRRCYFHLHHEDRVQEGYYFTFYLFGYGEDETESRQRWAIALKLVENALHQLSALTGRPGP